MKKKTAKILSLLGIVILVYAAFYAIAVSTARSRLRRIYADFEADGRPMELEDIVPAPIADVDNAALVYERAVLQLRAEPVGQTNLYGELKGLAEAICEDDYANIDKMADLMASEPGAGVLRDLLAAVEKEGCWYDLNYDAGFALLMPHLRDLRILTHILCAAARASSEKGRQAEAWDTVIAGLKLSEALRNEPLILSQMIRAWQVNITCRTIQSIAGNGMPSAAQCKKIEEALDRLDSIEQLIRANDGERIVISDEVFNTSGNAGELASMIGGIGGFLVRLSLSDPFGSLQEAHYMRMMLDQVRSFAQPPTALDSDLLEEQIGALPKYCFITRMIVPALGATKLRYHEMLGMVRVTRAGLAAMRHKAKEGAYPADLTGLDLSTSTDPFTQKSLIATNTTAGFRIYSVGRNFKDDGGITDRKTNKDDIAWLLK